MAEIGEAVRLSFLEVKTHEIFTLKEIGERIGWITGKAFKVCVRGQCMNSSNERVTLETPTPVVLAGITPGTKYLWVGGKWLKPLDDIWEFVSLEVEEAFSFHEPEHC